MWKRKILAIGIAAFLQAASKQSEKKNVKMKNPPGSHSLLQPVLARIVPFPCQFIVLPQTSSCSLASQHAVLETEKYWSQEKEETIDLKTVCHNQNLLNLCCCWHLWWLKEEQKEKNPIALPLIMLSVSFWLFSCPGQWSWDSFSSCALIINFPVVLLSLHFLCLRQHAGIVYVVKSLLNC